MVKPPYRVPSMEKIKALPWNGLNVVSTFSGCGGSTLGYKMAGFRVLWANEFIPAARDTYQANHFGTIVDDRDIRSIKPEEILKKIGLEVGELDLFDGSPPCASFSAAGKREKGWGEVKKYSDSKQRTDDLFFEYVRLLRGLKPKVFVAENVAGLVRGPAKGYFLQILHELKSSGYRVGAKLLDGQWLGVPQMRQRLIFVGVREDLAIDPAFPKPLSYQYTLREALPWLSPGVVNEFPIEPETDISRFAIGTLWDDVIIGDKHPKRFNLIKPDPDRPCNTLILAGGSTSSAGIVHPFEKRRFSIGELKRISAFPDDFILTGSYSKQWERLGRAVPPVMMFHIAKTIQDEIFKK